MPKKLTQILKEEGILKTSSDDKALDLMLALAAKLRGSTKGRVEYSRSMGPGGQTLDVHLIWSSAPDVSEAHYMKIKEDEVRPLVERSRLAKSWEIFYVEGYWHLIVKLKP